ncbi:hypothetical protein GGQ73_004694 [Rhizobium skierniewicense]|uniref:Uncharacterized protein n=1 Tax=Rhizobium skierniewicense TaxID=984260 RepID=A0A7W6CE90_9HYPH|nr:hypothetical protein [Rhizobium skierniewicense]MBB3948703.1 hypothetical protein [Rhizobium skierniewicense]
MIDDDAQQASACLDETKAKIREAFSQSRKIPAKLKAKAALKRSEG